MMRHSPRSFCLLIALIASYPLMANAQLAVVDVASLEALSQQIAAWKTQIEMMRSIIQNQTGNRGYANLLRPQPNQLNYLPNQWPQIQLGTNSTDAAISALANQNSLVTPAALAQLSQSMKNILTAQQRSNAQSQIYSQQAYANSALRVTHLNNLIDQINTTNDPQSTAELNVRLQGELLLLMNELTRLLSVMEASTADRSALTQQAREQHLNAQGSITNRFHPTPPGL